MSQISRYPTNSSVEFHNTAVDPTNYELVQLYWTGDVFVIGSSAGGTGTRRNMRLNSHGSLTFTSFSSTAGAIQLDDSTGTVNCGVVGVSGELSASSASQFGLKIAPTLNQSSTAGYTALLVNPTETSTGSGSKLLADFQVAGTSKVSISNTGVIAAAGFQNTGASRATAAGTTTLTIADAQVQVFTGTTTETVKLPTTGIKAGMSYTVVNNSSGNVTVQSSGANTVLIQSSGRMCVYTAKIDSPTGAYDWQMTGLTATTTATATTIAMRDSSANISADVFIPTKTAIATAAGTTTLDFNSTQVQAFTGTTTQTVKLPSTATAGTQYTIINQSTGNVTVQSSGANTIGTLTGGAAPTAKLYVALQDSPTAATHWREI